MATRWMMDKVAREDSLHDHSFAQVQWHFGFIFLISRAKWSNFAAKKRKGLGFAFLTNFSDLYFLEKSSNLVKKKGWPLNFLSKKTWGF